MQGVHEDDLSRRMADVAHRGCYALLGDLHPGIGVVGDRMRVRQADVPARTHHASALVLTPSVFVAPGVLVEDRADGSLVIAYAAYGVARAWLAPSARSREDEPLAPLMGRTRATILRHTCLPTSTTQLANRLGQSRASVSEHLAVLRDAGLVFGRRSGRYVLYRQTPLGEGVVRGEQAPLVDGRPRASRPA